MNFLKKTIGILVILITGCLTVLSTNYYVDNGGSDGNTGLTGHPWQHFGYAVSNTPSGTLASPNYIYLTAGETFAEDNSRLYNAIGLFITSSGPGPAYIKNVTPTKDFSYVTYSTNGVFIIFNSSAITISNLCFYGAGSVNTNTPYGIGIFTDTHNITNINIFNCQITNEDIGISIFDYRGDNAQEESNFKAVGNTIEDCSRWAIFLNFVNQNNSAYLIGTNMLTAFNTIYNITGAADGLIDANGITMMNVDGWECYSNTIYHLGYTPSSHHANAAIYPVFYCNHVHIWGNTVYDILPGADNGDGDGIDLDLGSRNCIVERNYIHDVSGPGDYADDPWTNNIYRWEVNINTGTNANASYGMSINNNGGDSLGGTNYYYNNTVIGPAGGIALLNRSSASNSVIANNIFQRTGSGTIINMDLNNPLPPTTNGVVFSHNDFGVGSTFLWGGVTYTSWGSFTNTTKIEVNTGFTNDPSFVGTGTPPANYYLQSTSVLHNAGIDIAGTYGVSAGTNDYLGNIVLSSGNNIGGLADANTLNVLTFGANGNATNFLVNTTSNSFVINCTNQLSANDVGKLVEIFGGGPLGTSTAHQDLIAVISSIASLTNITLDRKCFANLTNSFAVYGTNNLFPFQTCITADSNGEAIIIPAGTYLIIGTNNYANPNFVDTSPFNNYPSLIITNGGITFLGQGTNNTILLGCGAWQNFTNGSGGVNGYRGSLFELLGPIVNNGTLIFDSLTMSGGITNGYTTNNAVDIDVPVNGDGWDVTHDALVAVVDPSVTNLVFRNCRFTGWRGEQIKFLNGSDFAVTITNCYIGDGNASGVAAAPSFNIVNNTFVNLDQAIEFTQQYYSNNAYFQNNFVSNTTALLSINGARIQPSSNTYVLNNTFYQNSGNGIQFNPGLNVVISNNIFIGGVPIVIGIAGYAGATNNGNICVYNNIFTNNFGVIVIEGTGANVVNGLFVSNNIAYKVQTAPNFAGGYGYGTNMYFYDNTLINYTAGLDGSSLVGPYFIDSDSNIFPAHQISDGTGITNEISYEFGQKDVITTSTSASKFFTDNSASNQIPVNAKLIITNSSSFTVPVYSSTNLTGIPIEVAPSSTITVYWNPTNFVWYYPPQSISGYLGFPVQLLMK